jgi:electron transfer flavoprotein-quinone oxidoreductase
MLFNAPHREGTNLAMTSGRFAAEAAMEAIRRGDFTRRGLAGYAARLEASYVLKDMRKYRRFPHLLQDHKELFETLPGLAGHAAREMLTVDGTPKKSKQNRIWKTIRSKMSLIDLAKLAWDGWRSVR